MKKLVIVKIDDKQRLLDKNDNVITTIKEDDFEFTTLAEFFLAVLKIARINPRILLLWKSFLDGC